MTVSLFGFPWRWLIKRICGLRRPPISPPLGGIPKGGQNCVPHVPGVHGDRVVSPAAVLATARLGATHEGPIGELRGSPGDAGPEAEANLHGSSPWNAASVRDVRWY